MTERQTDEEPQPSARHMAHKLFCMVGGALGLEGFSQQDVKGNLARMGRVKHVTRQETEIVQHMETTIPASSETPRAVRCAGKSTAETSVSDEASHRD